MDVQSAFAWPTLPALRVEEPGHTCHCHGYYLSAEMQEFDSAALRRGGSASIGLMLTWWEVVVTLPLPLQGSWNRQKADK